MAGDAGSADGMLQERHELPDAQVGVAPLRLEARDHSNTGRQLLRRCVQPHAFVRREFTLRPLERVSAPGPARPGVPGPCARAAGVARPRPAARLAHPETPSALRNARLADSVSVCLPGSDPGTRACLFA